MQYPLQRGSIEESWYKWNSHFFFFSKKTEDKHNKNKTHVVFASGRENLPEVRMLPIGLSL